MSPLRTALFGVLRPTGISFLLPHTIQPELERDACGARARC